MAKLWQKGNNNESELAKKVEKFTVGKDKELDLLLAKFDVLGTLAHTKMLNKINLLSTEDYQSVQAELKEILNEIDAGKFIIQAQSEDIHSEIEFR
ncbi:MAG TPA: hypothetical protein PLO32_10990 [Chitinophagales bacterium]|nr:hypothetical protein [Chitinophagales bacterium]